jgi:formate-dependent nitrite reductase membrane component NrfD
MESRTKNRERVGPVKRASNEAPPGRVTTSEIYRQPNPRAQAEEGYYGLPMLKEPTWEWHVALYFFLEGISAGSFLLASMADLFGRRSFRGLARAGYYTSLAALMPCPYLLIADLGRPERFHHMLRIFKPSSPMNLGAWTLLAFGGPLTLLTARHLAEDLGLSVAPLEAVDKILPARAQAALGVPLALVLASYPGVLLATTSNPLWSKSRWLGALFSSSAVGTGAAALTAHVAFRGDDEGAIERLGKIKSLAAMSEAAALAGFLVSTGRAAEPITKGRYRRLFWLGAVGAGLVAPALVAPALVAPALIGAGSDAGGPPKNRKRNLVRTILGSALSLAGGLALKWALTHAGKLSVKKSSEQSIRDLERI